jgi:two-component system sensor histidine kinase/response regulator
MMIDSNHPGLGLKDRKILIVADDRAKVFYLTEILSPEGYQIADVNSGAAALDHYAQFEPDVVLLDVELPGPSVFQLCRSLKNSHNSGDGAPIIFITSKRDSEEVVVEGLAAGGVDYLTKPFRKQEILARIRVHLRNRLRLAQLNRDDTAKNRLLGMAAHDLRNPLASIRALTDFLEAGTVGPLAPEQRDLLKTIHDASHSMLQLVNELLNVSVLEAGELQINAEATSLAELVESCVKMSNALAVQKGSAIVLKPGPLPQRLTIDSSKIGQVLNNLLGNAIKFSPAGSTITVEREFTTHHCAITIQDQGPGVPEKEQDKLFKDYSRTSVKPTGGETSTGLGLSICHKIMLAHGGTIRMENVPGGGAKFRITFPVEA